MRIVIKIGTSTITHPTGRLNIRQMEALCKVLSDLKNAGNEVILVSSGAIGMGVGKLRLGKRPADVPTKQAAAAVGQCELMYTYDKLFSEYRHTVAQILLTADDIADPVRHENFQNTIQRLLDTCTTVQTEQEATKACKKTIQNISIKNSFLNIQTHH